MCESAGGSEKYICYSWRSFVNTGALVGFGPNAYHYHVGGIKFSLSFLFSLLSFSSSASVSVFLTQGRLILKAGLRSLKCT